MNSCYNAVDRHVLAGRGKQTAIQYESPMTGQSFSLTYLELQKQTAKFAGMLVEQGLKKGDRVIIYMPMITEAVISMLGCARIGVVHSVVFGGFAAAELAKRIDDCKPKLIISASCGHEPTRLVQYKPLLDKAIQQSKFKPSKTPSRTPSNAPSNAPLSASSKFKSSMLTLTFRSSRLSIC